MRKNSWAEVKMVSFSCWSVLSCFLFSSCDDRLANIVILLRSIGLSVALEPMRLFSDFEPDDNRRPDILIRNPYGGGRQIIIDVANKTSPLPLPATLPPLPPLPPRRT